MKKTLELFVDGASQGNPGEAAIGVAVKESGRFISKISQSIGQATNNAAEYLALIYGLQEALILKAEAVVVNTDSELLFEQVRGRYKVKNPNLKLLYAQVQHLLKGFRQVDIRHIPREKNREADALAAEAIKKEQAKVVTPTASFCCAKRSKTVGEESPSSKG